MLSTPITTAPDSAIQSQPSTMPMQGAGPALPPANATLLKYQIDFVSGITGPAVNITYLYFLDSAPGATQVHVSTAVAPSGVQADMAATQAALNVAFK